MKMKLMLMAAASLLVLGCSPERERGANPCPRGDVVETTHGEVCVYQAEIVIETGFQCPPDFPFSHSIGDAVVCTTRQDIPTPVLEQAVEEVTEMDWNVRDNNPGPGTNTGTNADNHFYNNGVLLPGEGSVDILWVIDNSGSMCQQQSLLRANFARFIDRLDAGDLDFHMAVTTTHMATREQYPFESVAQAGHFQSTPQPVPGFNASCYYDLPADGTLNTDNLAPILESIEVAIACTTDPSAWSHLLDPDQRALQCALDAGRWGCDSSEIGSPEEFFPPSAAYRAIPKVLRAMEYRDAAGALDVGRLQQDFACMSMVGTRGYGFEKGLLAAVTALSPELLSGPNSGFLRGDAMTGIVFVTDENDCSHDETLNERSTCSFAECTFEENDPEGALLAVDALQAELLEHLSQAKGKDVHPSQVLTASFHGRYQRFEEPHPGTCPQGFDIPTSCASEFGQAYSGHRYDAFIRQFPRHFPTAQGDAPLPGLICGDFGPEMVGLADLFHSAAAQ
ncbi:MAG: hypothetical protein ACNA8W_17525 [Bradymonadaceae bacterium]